MLKENRIDLLILLSVVILGVATITLRGFIPYDETRYIAVAWEMWRDNSFFIPRINGEIYADKPPLLFWLIHAGWYLTGVNEWWPRSIPFIFSLFNIFLTRNIAIQLWPGSKKLKQAVPLVLIAMPLWLLYSTPMMFDMLQVFFVLVALTGLLQFHNRNYSGAILFGAACGLGFLLKGPVIFIYVLPVALTLPFWDKKFTSGYRNLLLQIFAGLFLSGIIISVWIVPAIHLLGMDQVRELFWHQTAGRVVHATSHSRPFWWYLYFIPLLLFPWFYRIAFIRMITVKPEHVTPQILFCMVWLLTPFFLLSLIDAKQLHYLLPLLPALSIVIAYKLIMEKDTAANSYWPVGIIYILLGLVLLIKLAINFHIHQASWIYEMPAWWSPVAIFAGLILVAGKIFYKSPVVLPAMATLITMFSIYFCVLLGPRPFTDVDHMSHILARLQEKNVPLVNIGSHREQFEFAGRLTRPLDKIEINEIRTWALEHPDGYIVARVRETDSQYEKMKTIYKQPYRFKHMLILVSSSEMLANEILQD